MNKPIKYLSLKSLKSLKSAKANKIGQRSIGEISYRILTDQTHQQLYIIITGNDDDGYYSKEIVPFEKIEQSLEGIKPNIPIPSKLFKSAFIGKSNNNAAFLAAILRAEGLITPVTDATRKHTLQPGWDSWKAKMLKDAAKAKPFEPELAMPKKESKPTTKSENSELDDAEMALLLQHSAREVLDKEPEKKRSKKPS